VELLDLREPRPRAGTPALCCERPGHRLGRIAAPHKRLT
jgi:hypothetical protein